MYALRMFRRAPVFTGAFVLVMALGVGATTAVFALVDGLVLRPSGEPAGSSRLLSAPSFLPDLQRGGRRAAPGFSTSLAAWSVEDEHVAWTQQLEQSEVPTASGGFYDTLGVTAVVGRTFSDADDRIGGGPEGRVAVISYPRGSGATAEILPSWGGPSASERTPTPSSASRRRLLRRPRRCAGDHDSAHQQRQAVVAAVGDLELGPPDRPPARWRLARRGQHGTASVSGRPCWRARSGKVPANRRDSFLGRQTSLESARPASRASATGSQSPCGSFLAWSRCCSRLRRRARPTCCSRAAPRGGGNRRAPGDRRRPDQAGAADADRVDGADVDGRGRRAADRDMGRRLAAALMTTREQVISLDAGISAASCCSLWPSPRSRRRSVR